MTPTARAEVVQEAVAEDTFTEEHPDIDVPPDMKLIVPDPPEPTVAVRITGLPIVDSVAGKTASVVVVADPDRTGTRGEDLTLYKFFELEYA